MTMSRLGISFADVTVAADDLVEAGEQPTIEKIRDHLGKRGSFSTISKYLKDWRDGRPVMKTIAISPPDQVQVAVSAVWEKLHQEAEETIQAVKVEASAQVAAAQKQAEEAASVLSTMKAEYENLQTAHRSLSSQKEILVLDYKQAEDKYQLLHERYGGLEIRHHEIKTLHEQQIKRLEEKYQQEMIRMGEHTQQEVQLAHQLADTLKAHYEEARTAGMLQLDQLKIENKKSHDEIKHLESENMGVKKELAAQITAREKAVSQIEQAEALITKQQAQWDIIKDKRFVTEDIIAAFQQLPMDLTNQIQSILTKQIEIVINNVVEAERLKYKRSEHA
jgi:hypothetical protein